MLLFSEQAISQLHPKQPLSGSIITFPKRLKCFQRAKCFQRLLCLRASESHLTFFLKYILSTRIYKIREIQVKYRAESCPQSSKVSAGWLALK